jgi:hypothetical protein
MTVHNLFVLLLTALGAPKAGLAYARAVWSVKLEVTGQLRLAAM